MLYLLTFDVLKTHFVSLPLLACYSSVRRVRAWVPPSVIPSIPSLLVVSAHLPTFQFTCKLYNLKWYCVHVYSIWCSVYLTISGEILLLFLCHQACIQFVTNPRISSCAHFVVQKVKLVLAFCLFFRGKQVASLRQGVLFCAMWIVDFCLYIITAMS